MMGVYDDKLYKELHIQSQSVGPSYADRHLVEFAVSWMTHRPIDDGIAHILLMDALYNLQGKLTSIIYRLEKDFKGNTNATKKTN